MGLPADDANANANGPLLLKDPDEASLSSVVNKLFVSGIFAGETGALPVGRNANLKRGSNLTCDAPVERFLFLLINSGSFF